MFSQRNASQKLLCFEESSAKMGWREYSIKAISGKIRLIWLSLCEQIQRRSNPGLLTHHTPGIKITYDNQYMRIRAGGLSCEPPKPGYPGKRIGHEMAKLSLIPLTSKMDLPRSFNQF